MVGGCQNGTPIEQILLFDNLWTKIPAVELAEYCIKGAPIVGVTPPLVFKIGESCCFEDQLYIHVY